MRRRNASRVLCILVALVFTAGIFMIPEKADAKGKNKTVYIITKAVSTEEADGSGIEKYKYNKKGLLTYVDHGSAINSSYKFQYKNTKIVKATQDMDGITVYTVKYNKKGKIKSIKHFDHTFDGEKYTYACKIKKDKKGRVLKVIDNGDYTYKYNKNNQVIKEKTGGNYIKTLKLKYNRKGELIKINGIKLKYNKKKKTITKPMKGYKIVYKYKKISVPKKYVKKILIQQNCIKRDAQPIDYITSIGF